MTLLFELDLDIVELKFLAQGVQKLYTDTCMYCLTDATENIASTHRRTVKSEIQVQY